MAEFAHLHLHTEYSLLDGVNRVGDVMEKVKSDGMEAVAMTDHGVMNGYVEFWKAAKDNGLKPILGCEIYVAPKSRFDRQEVDGIKYYHLVLLAQNKTGFHNLIKLVSLGHKEGYYYNPRVDRELLQKYNEGIVVTSACLASPIARNISLDRMAEAEDWLQFFRSTFPGRFFLELQRNGFEGKDEITPEIEKTMDPDWVDTIKAQIKVNNKLRDYAAQYDLPLVATTDAHFLNEEDKEVQKILFCIQDGIQLNDPRAREGYIGTYVATQEEMLLRFADDKTPLTNTLRVAEMVENFDINLGRIQPKFWNVQPGKTAGEELQEQAYAGAQQRYGEITPALKERIDYELKVIHDKGYDDYFLVVSDILKWSARNGIVTGTRGSVAGSVVAYCLDIVKIDPLKWELYFERFLNPERPSPPDIDMDIQDSRREEVIDYVREKYGEEAVVGICTFGRFQTKAAIRDTARVMGIDLAVADKLSKMVNVVFGKNYSIDQQLEVDPEFKQIIESDPQLLKLADTVRKITDLSRNLSIHAAGYLITPDEIVEYTPIQKESRGENMITQLEFGNLEDIGLMKFDFLGLRTLSILADAISLIKSNRGVEIELGAIPDNDAKTYELFGRGETIGVFQFESPPMRKYLQELKPENQEDLCFMAAAYRPGAMDYIPDYIKCKNGEKQAKYLVPELEPIMGKTFGYPIYQEQALRIAVNLAGYSMGESDVLRRAIGKKKREVMEKEGEKFRGRLVENGYTPELAQQIWDLLPPFADYGFNKAHSAAYAVLAYQCAYLKANYPLEFMAALLHADLNDYERIVIDIKEAQRMGFKVAPPDINKSQVNFTVEGDDTIRFGLAAVKNVGHKVCEAIVESRGLKGEFANLDDFIDKVGTTNLNKKSLECLIKVGTFEAFGERSALLAIMPLIFDRAGKQGAAAAMGQIDLFGHMLRDSGKPVVVTATPLPQIPPVSDAEKIQWEKELIGIFLTTHPLQKYFWSALVPEIRSIIDLAEMREGTNVKVLVSIDDLKTIRTKNGNKPMSFLTISDASGTTEAVMFSETHLKYIDSLNTALAYIVAGKVSFRNDKVSILIDSVTAADEMTPPTKITLNICGIDNQEALMELRDCFDEAGTVKVKILYGNSHSPKIAERKMLLKQQCVEGVLPYLSK